MPKYVIERNIPNVGDVTRDQIIGISQKSCGMLNNMGPQIQWLHSCVTHDKSTACISRPTKKWFASMPNTGSPANSVTEVRHVIDPASAET